MNNNDVPSNPNENSQAQIYDVGILRKTIHWLNEQTKATLKGINKAKKDKDKVAENMQLARMRDLGNRILHTEKELVDIGLSEP